MKKASRVLIYLGLIGTFSCQILRVLHIGREYLLPVIAPSLLLVGIGFAMAIPATYKKYKTPAARFLLTLFCVGFALIYSALIIKLVFGIPCKAVLNTGMFIMIGTSLFYIIYALVGVLGITAPKGTPASASSLIAHGITDEDLDRFTGIYKNDKMPMTITVRNKDAKLTAQANGQAAFYLDPISKTAFEYVNGGIEIEFNIEKNELILKQHGGFFPFVKEQ